MDADGAHPRMALRHVLIVRKEVNQRSSVRRSSLLRPVQTLPPPPPPPLVLTRFSRKFPKLICFLRGIRGPGVSACRGKLYRVSLGAFCCFESEATCKTQMNRIANFPLQDFPLRQSSNEDTLEKKKRRGCNHLNISLHSTWNNALSSVNAAVIGRVCAWT